MSEGTVSMRELCATAFIFNSLVSMEFVFLAKFLDSYEEDFCHNNTLMPDCMYGL